MLLVTGVGVADAMTDDIGAIFPGLDVKVLGVVVAGDDDGKGTLEQLPVLVTDVQAQVLIVEMMELSIEDILVRQQGDGHVETSENSQAVSLELGGPDVVTVYTGEDSAGGGILEEELLPEFSGEMFPVGTLGEYRAPLVLHLQTLKGAAFGRSHRDQTSEYY